MSAAAQALVNSFQPMRVAERVARTRHSRSSLRNKAMQESCEQSLAGWASRMSGSPSKPDASANRLRT